MAMFKVSGVWSFLGVGFSLVALYLVLENGSSFTSAVNAIGSNTTGFYKTLQGR